jgi:dynein light chain LC8-type
MAEADSLYKQVFGVRLQVPCDMPDDVLAFCVQLAKAELAKVHDWQAEGDATVASCKAALDKAYGENWHVVIGKHFGSKVTHEAKMFAFFYVGDRACLFFKLSAQ